MPRYFMHAARNYTLRCEYAAHERAFILRYDVTRQIRRRFDVARLHAISSAADVSIAMPD